MIDIWTRLKEEERPILLYGTGNGADKILNELYRLGISVSGVFASDGFVRRREYRGFRVMSLGEAEELFGDFVGLFSFGSDRPEVMDNIKHIMSRHTLLAPEVPVADGEIFTLDFAKRHKAELERVYNALADEKSREVFKETILFKLDGDINRLFSCECERSEPFEILSLQKGDSFLDLGAYNGDTVREFISLVGEFSHITALEPDPKSFSKLVRFTEGLDIERINAAVSSECGFLKFSSKASRGSTAGGDIDIPSLTVDSITENKSFSYIKFDVEGKELDALLGAEHTVKRDKPKMRIAAYHKSEDYFKIPLLVLKYNPDYKLYMRHLPSVPAWDTDFLFKQSTEITPF